MWLSWNHVRDRHTDGRTTATLNGVLRVGGPTHRTVITHRRPIHGEEKVALILHRVSESVLACEHLRGGLSEMQLADDASQAEGGWVQC